MAIGWLDSSRDWVGKVLGREHENAVNADPFESGDTWDHFFLHYSDIPDEYSEAVKLEAAIPHAKIWVYGGAPITEDMLPRTSRVIPVRYQISKCEREAPPRFLRLLETLAPELAELTPWPENLVAIYLLCRARELRVDMQVKIDRAFVALTDLVTGGRKEYYELTGNELGEGELSELCGPISRFLNDFTKRLA